MDIFEAIEKRASYRKQFEDTKVPREDLAKIADAGIRAPSGCNAQTTSFVLIDDEGIMGKLRETVSNSAIKTATAAIAVLSRDEAVYHGMSFAKEDYSAATQNMLLAITALGYATVWIDGELRRGDKAGRIAALLGVPDGLTVSVLLPLGVPKEEIPQRERKPFSERAWFNGYKK
jgi:nitroreductase